jgi:hypothetical protein
VGHNTDTLLGGAGCAGRLGAGVAATGCGGGLADVGLTAAFTVGLAFLGDPRLTGAFFAGFFLTVAVFLRVVPLVTGAFLPFALVLRLTFLVFAIYGLHGFSKGKRRLLAAHLSAGFESHEARAIRRTASMTDAASRKARADVSPQRH